MPKKKTGEAKRVSKASAAPSSSATVRQLRPKGFRARRVFKKANAKKFHAASSPRLFGQAVMVLSKNWSLFLGIIIIYAILTAILVGSLSVADSNTFETVKQTLSQFLGGLLTGISLFAYLAGSSATGGTYQVIIMIVISLALIWALRQVYVADRLKKPRLRDAFYEGVAPVIKFILVLVVLALELVPLAIGAFLYSIAIVNNIAITGLEKALFGAIFFLLATASLYMLTGSAFAPYIVTLKGIAPVKALKSSSALTRYHRGRIFLKLLFVVVVLIIIAGLITVPLALYVTAAAPYVFFGLLIVFLAIFHSYVYALYRELI